MEILSLAFAIYLRKHSIDWYFHHNKQETNELVEYLQKISADYGVQLFDFYATVVG